MSEADSNNRIAIVSEDKVRERAMRAPRRLHNAHAVSRRRSIPTSTFTLCPQKISLSPQCKPKKCRQECGKSCPVVRMGKECIKAAPTSKLAWISEELCIGCGICVKKCPFEAITIINIPRSCVPRAARAPLPRAN